MGKKKKFIDKKKAATFHLFARDSPENGQSQGPDSDHVFVRVDNNPVRIDGFHEIHGGDSSFDGLADDPDSTFADTPEDESFTAETGPLPGQLRREIVELGFPDDGYDYLIHMREIKNRGGGSVYYHNSKFKLNRIPIDVKAYDASEVEVKGANAEADEENIMYSVAEKSLNVGVQSAVDLEVMALLDDGDSQLGSDAEDLEEDFVVQANLPDEGDCPGEGKDRIDDVVF